MIEIDVTTNLDVLRPLKSEYLDKTTAPLDGMWLCGFLPLASHFGIHRNSELIGYCCINEEGNLLQFYLHDEDISDRASLFSDMIAGKYRQLPEINGAFVSTAEPEYLSHCFDNFASFKVKAVMYQLGKDLQSSVTNKNCWSLEPAGPKNLSEAVEFAARNVGASEEWLNQYLSNLIRRGELFGCWLDNRLIGTGENRIFDDVQKGYTDIGVIVDQQHRGKGLATWIIRQLIQQAIEKGVKPICSTEAENIGAQKTITKAGFVARNRIIQFMI